ncbi:MAG: HAMP domain-containing protein [Deltaproteobacteria bacterium]|nr:HAMP domain-containing protein [Deltaproteobacteria bacterium]MBW1952042.1 HAMP domain-containing protein [Deltaproteobacteria bacterium]MBW1986935.1 HAMP domain-containing protein [Deltaproteobacteria bacterium]MBW2134076.1 HAMP domain-containing protein [Deltaproteobacteria bacterium]
MRRKRLLWHLYPSYLIITIISLVAVTWYISRVWEQLYLKQMALDLGDQASLLAMQVQKRLGSYQVAEIDALCKSWGQASHTRFTIILPSGQVLGDSHQDPAEMDNHADRPEIQGALAGQTVTITRKSYTLNQYMMYVALPHKEQGQVSGVVRAAIPVTTIDQALKAIYVKIALGGLAIALIAAALSLFISRRITRPLEEMKRGAARFAQGNLDRKVPVPASDELGSLAEALNQMAAQLDDRIRTILRQRQEHEAILSSMVEGVIAVDRQGHIITLNTAGARLLGVEPHAVRHRSIQEVIRNTDLQWFVSRAQSAIAPIEGEIVLNDEEERFLQAHGTQLRDLQGAPIGALIVVHDVTRLRGLENARRDFVANVSHELRTPITSIKGFVETLQDRALAEPEKAQEFLDIIARQADRLNQIIEDLLSLSRLEQEADQVKFSLIKSPINEVIQGAVQACASRAAAKGINIVTVSKNDVQAPINPHLLEQALVNLIDNAIKYSPAGSIVQVKTDSQPQEIIIRVEDQGIGISKEHQSRIFERFYRVDASRSRKIGGTGLGLAIVKHIAQAHGGRVTVESTPGKGSVFSLHLPQNQF